MRGFQDTRLYLLPFCIIALYALFSSFYAHLDDAFIHLRYAEHLLEAGRYSFNGQDPDFGISSPLYPALLSIAVTLGLGPLAPKICSLVIFWHYSDLLKPLLWT